MLVGETHAGILILITRVRVAQDLSSSSPASDHHTRLFSLPVLSMVFFPIVPSTILHCKFEFHHH